MSDAEDTLWIVVLFALAFIGSCAGCVSEATEKTAVCEVAASTSPTLRDSVALNNAGCDLKLSTVQPETPR